MQSFEFTLEIFTFSVFKNECNVLWADMSIYFRTVSRWRVTMSRKIFPMSWWVRHAECDKFIPCRNSKPRRTVLYQFPCLTRSMTSECECVFVICDMWVWYITFYESHNNTNCMILYKQGWHPPPDMGLCSSSGMYRHECLLWQTSRIFSSRVTSRVFFNRVAGRVT